MRWTKQARADSAQDLDLPRWHQGRSRSRRACCCAKGTLGEAGGVIVRLWPDEAVTTGLGIAEEHRDCKLSLAHALPACLGVHRCSGNLGALPVLAGIEVLAIGVDADAAPGATPRAGLRRAMGGRTAQVLLVEPPAGDLNNVAAEEEVSANDSEDAHRGHGQHGQAVRGGTEDKHRR